MTDIEVIKEIKIALVMYRIRAPIIIGCERCDCCDIVGDTPEKLISKLPHSFSPKLMEKVLDELVFDGFWAFATRFPCLFTFNSCYKMNNWGTPYNARIYFPIEQQIDRLNERVAVVRTLRDELIKLKEG